MKHFNVSRKWLLVIPVAGLLLYAAGAFADSNSTDFETTSGFTTGSVNGQNGWKAGAAYDQEVVTGSLPPSFGGQALRISDAVTSGSFDWIYAKPVVDGAGEATATGTVDLPVGTRQTHFEASFDILSAAPDLTQGGLHLSVSPDRGDGSRMSWLLFEDTWNGIDVTFADVPGTNTDPDFEYTQVATDLDKSVPHNVKFVMDFVDGASNDVVKIYIDSVLVHTGRSWENYYRHSSEQLSEPTPRVVKTLLFQSRANFSPMNQPDHEGDGFLIDNVNLSSSVPATTPEEPEGDATIRVTKVFLGGGSGCADVTVDATTECLSNGQSMEVDVAAGEHVVSEEADNHSTTIVCFSNGSVAGWALPFNDPTVTLDVDAGDFVSCTVYNVAGSR